MRDASMFHITSTSDDGVVSARPAVVERVVIGTEVASQTLKLYDVAAEADVAAGNLKLTLKTDTRGSFEVRGRFGTGIVAILSGGTVDIAVVWS